MSILWCNCFSPQGEDFILEEKQHIVEIRSHAEVPGQSLFFLTFICGAKASCTSYRSKIKFQVAINLKDLQLRGSLPNYGPLVIDLVRLL